MNPSLASAPKMHLGGVVDGFTRQGAFHVRPDFFESPWADNVENEMPGDLQLLLAVSMSLFASSSRSILSLAIRLLAPSVKVGILPLEPAAAGLSRP